MTIAAGLARSLVSSLGDDAAAAACVLASAMDAQRGASLDAASLRSVPKGGLLAAVADFERRGWLVRHGQSWTVPEGGMPREVPAFLQGVAALQASLTDKEPSYAAVTMPLAPSALAIALPATGVAHAALLSTADAMARVALAAEERMTILTPFLNADGLRFAASLFERSPATSRTLILRRSAAVLRVLTDDADRLVDLGIRLLIPRLVNQNLCGPRP